MSFLDTKKSKEQETLEKFLSMSVRSSDEVFDEFAKIEGAQVYGTEPLKRFIYIPGTRDDRVLLVAHADTVWDKNWNVYEDDGPQSLKFGGGVYYNTDRYSHCGIGADDRAGCAILHLLKDSGHSILILDGEEHGQIGANFLKDEYPEIYQEINEHQFALQFDRRNGNDYKCYSIPVTEQFKDYIESNFSYKNAGTKSRTDLVVLCKDICGANLSVGYRDEHTSGETLCYKEWLNTYNLTAKFLEKEQKQFKTKPLVEEENHTIDM